MTLGTNPTIQAADSNANPFNIALSGTLGGTGGFTKTGGGVLTLSAADSYTGATAVSAGTMIVSGSLTGTTGVSVASTGKLEVDGLLNNSISATVSGQLSGTGSIGGAAVTAGTLAPGLTAANSSTAVGTLTASSGVSLASNSTFSIRIGLTNGAASNSTTGLGGDTDQLFMNGGTFSLADTTTTLSIASGADTLLDTLYVIVNGGAGGTGASGDVFVNAPTSGGSFQSNGATYEIFYATDAANDGNPGNDIAIEELAAVPEPGTWASLLGGIGMLIAWQRTRRRRD
jgi:autotransporter-associated beta strand protein